MITPTIPGNSCSPGLIPLSIEPESGVKRVVSVVEPRLFEAHEAPLRCVESYPKGRVGRKNAPPSRARAVMDSPSAILSRRIPVEIYGTRHRAVRAALPPGVPADDQPVDGVA